MSSGVKIDKIHKVSPLDSGLTSNKYATPMDASRLEVIEKQKQIDELNFKLSEATKRIVGTESKFVSGGRSVHGGYEVEIKPPQEIFEGIVACLAGILQNSNYTETGVSIDAKDYTVTIEHRKRPTAHELRKKAEADLEKALEALEKLTKTCDDAGVDLLAYTWGKNRTGIKVITETLKLLSDANSEAVGILNKLKPNQISPNRVTIPAIEECRKFVEKHAGISFEEFLNTESSYFAHTTPQLLVNQLIANGTYADENSAWIEILGMLKRMYG